ACIVGQRTRRAEVEARNAGRCRGRRNRGDRTAVRQGQLDVAVLREVPIDVGVQMVAEPAGLQTQLIRGEVLRLELNGLRQVERARIDAAALEPGGVLRVCHQVIGEVV